jgi:hypothetical protein
MAFSLRVIPGYQFTENEKLTQTKLNQLGRPTIELQGSISSAAIAPGSITADKLSPVLISDLTPGDPIKDDLMMYQDLDLGLRSTTIGKILALGSPTLTQINAVTLADYAWVIQGGKDYKATIADTLREAINQQTPLDTVGAIDKTKDMLLLFDASAPDNSNKNRKATLATAVATATNTLIADATGFQLGGTLDRFNDEILMNDASLAVGSQQVRVKLNDVLIQAGGIKAWANINGAATYAQLATNLWDTTSDVIGCATPHLLNAGDVIWFVTVQPGTGVAAFTPYFVNPLGTGLQFKIYTTKAGAIAADATKVVDLIGSGAGMSFLKWVNNPIRAGNNIAAVLRTGDNTTNPSSNAGQYRIYFETPMATANYAVQLTGSAYSGDQDQQALIAFVNVAGTNSNPDVTQNPSTTSFDVATGRGINEYHNPDYLMVTVFQ